MKTSKYFNEIDLSRMDQKFINMLDNAREAAGIPFVINSAYRDPEHNRRVGGVENSAHTKGLAVDIRCNNSANRFKIVTALLQAGFKRIGISKTFIHVDNDLSKPNPVVFLY